MKTIIIILSALLTGCGINTAPGTGEKVGQVVKLSKQGLFRDTWEAQLIRGGMNNGSGSFGMKPFDFTIEDEKTADLVSKYMKDQTEVTLAYRMEGFYSIFRTDSNGRFLVRIEPSKK